MPLLNVEEASMSKNHADHEADRERTVGAHDIHDIRALTTTGAISLPQRVASPQGGKPQTGG